MTVLVLNAGSSSIKYALFDLPRSTPLVQGVIEHIGETHGTATHEAAFDVLLERLLADGIGLSDIDAAGHRVVHGGERYNDAVLITSEVIKDVMDLSRLAPLHNPANALGMRVLLQKAPHLRQVAVFDTAFHQTMPPQHYLYALPMHLYETHHIRRYGFHGSSHHYVAMQAAKLLNKPLKLLNLITVHLGNGASMCAIENGVSIDTSMGFTPLEGLVMGSRSGDVDASIVRYLVDHAGMTLGDVDAMLNKSSGLVGLCGTNDMRDILARCEADDEKAKLAFDIYTTRIKKYLGGYMALLGRVDGIVFTGGVGEHAQAVREAVLSNMTHLGIVLDAKRSKECCLSAVNSTIAVWVIPTNEELYIAQQTLKVVQSLKHEL